MRASSRNFILQGTDLLRGGAPFSGGQKRPDLLLELGEGGLVALAKGGHDPAGDRLDCLSAHGGVVVEIVGYRLELGLRFFQLLGVAVEQGQRGAVPSVVES